MRNLPEVKKDQRRGYAVCLAKGYDTVKETFKLVVPDEVYNRFKVAKEKAQAYQKNHKKDFWTIEFGGQEIQVSYRGIQGATYFAKCGELFEIHVRTNNEWPITIRYSSAGLWQFGIDELRKQVRDMLLAECWPACSPELKEDETHWVTLTGCDVAFDFYSPDFSDAMQDFNILGNIICNSKVKKSVDFKLGCQAFSRGSYLETITIGKKDSLQIQVYDKGHEIKDQSGKDWMVKLWELEGFHPPEQGERIEHVWRVELRFGKEFLKNRNIKGFEEFDRHVQELVAEALHSRRLTVQTDDKNRSRWPMHPLWCAVHEESGLAIKMVPIGKQLTMSGQEFINSMVKQTAGIIRSSVVAKIGDYDDYDADDFIKRVVKELKEDDHHEMKVLRAQERYKTLGDAR